MLDACVIFRATLRDPLLRAAAAGLYEVYWSDMILEEVSRNLVKTSTMNTEQAQRLIRRMREFFRDSTVTGFEDLIGSMTNDEKDRHVLAAVVVADADTIVTSNLKDFPERALAPLKIKAMLPNQFLMSLFGVAPETMTRIVIEQAEQLKNYPKTVGEVLDAIAWVAPQFAAAVRSGLGEQEYR
ncbi:MAG: PIN domain-containing protein [Hormoscilla sp. SP12CHS1]|nr:PIN domain-containing protein [Hormoscilla sp. SP12CHS1]